MPEEQLENHKIVVKEFIRLNLLDIGLKFSFSEILIRWDDSPETKDLLRKAWANPAEDMGQYVEQLREESESDENYQAFEFLRIQIEELEKEIKDFEIPQEIALNRIESRIKRLKRIYPDQVNVAEKLDEFLISYENMQESLKN